MNKIFRIVWSQATQSWVVVSELTKAHKKQSSSNAQKSAVKFSGNFIKSSAIALSLLSVHSAYAVLNNPGTGDGNGVAWGENSTGSGSAAVAIGKDANATGYQSIAIGKGAISSHNSTVALGQDSKATGSGASALSVGATASGNNSVAIAYKSKASGTRAIAIGEESNASSEDGIALGYQTQATLGSAVAIGREVVSSGDSAVALGKGSKATSDSAIALGQNSQANGSKAATLGVEARASGEKSLALANKSEASGAKSIAIGDEAGALADNTIALGTGSWAKPGAGDSIAIGRKSTAHNSKALAFGPEANAGGSNSLAFGPAANATAGNALAFGYQSAAYSDNTISIGSNTQARGNGSISMGVNAKSNDNAEGTIVIGRDAFSEGSGNGYRPNTVVGRGAYTAFGEGGSYRLNASTALGFQAGAGVIVDPDNNRKLVRNNTNADNNAEVLVKAGYGIDDNAPAETKAALQAGSVHDGLVFYRKRHINEGTAIGVESRAVGDQSIAIGGQVVAGDGVVALGGNDSDALRDSKYQVVTDNAVRNTNVSTIDDYNLAYTESTNTVAGQYQNLVGRGMPASYKSTYGQSGSVVIGMHAHSTTALGTAIGTNSVVRMGAFGATAIGAGSTVQPNAEAAVAIGMGSVANGAYSLAGGTASWAEYGDIALGYQAKASGKDGAIAMGRATNAQGDSSIMIGGANIESASKQSTNYEKANGQTIDKTVTEKINGHDITRKYSFAATTTTPGTVAEAYKELTGRDMNISAIDFANTSNKNGHASTSLGVHSLAKGNLATAIGAGSRADAIGSVALGVGAQATRQNAVAIGTGSTTDFVGTRQLSVNYDSDGNIVSDDSKDIAYTFKWAGGINTSEGDVVSFGSSGAERQLKNVAAGRVAEDSTDAINGSQLNSITKRIAAGFNTSGNVVTDSSGVFTSKKANTDSAKKDYETAIRSEDKVQFQVGNNLKLDRNETESEIEVTDDFDKTKKVKKKIRKADFAYSLNPVLTNLTSAEFKGTGTNAPTTKLTNEGVTITPVTAGKNPVSLTENGLDNGGNAISNVAGNLPSTKNNDAAETDPSNATKSQDAPTLGNTANQVNPTNAATVSDVLNAGWNIQGDGKAVDFVKPYDTVNFVKGDGTSVAVESADGKTSTVKYSVNLGNGLDKDSNNNITVKAADKSLTVDTNGVKVNPADKSLEVTDAGLKVKAGDKTLTTDENGLKVNTGDIESVTTGANPGTVKVKDEDAGKIATVDSVVKAVNSAAFTLKASANGGTRNTGSRVTETGESIKAGSTVEMIAGKNLDVKHDTNGKITFATVDNPSFSTVQVGGDQGPKLSKTDEGDLKVSGQNGTDPVKITNVKPGEISETSTDAINGSQIHGLVKNTIKLAGKNGETAAGETEGQALNKEGGIKFTVKSSDGSLLEVAAEGDTITLTPKTGKITTGADGVPTANTDGGKLVTADQLVTALTEMGWKATADKEGTGTVEGNAEELIKAGSKVTFKAGDNLAVKQAGKDFIYSLKTELTGLTSAEFKNAAGDKTVINGDGVTITPVTNGKQPVSLTTNGLNNGGNPITNVAGNLDGAKAGTDAPTTKHDAPNTTEATGPNYVNPNNAATVGDVLQAGWNLQNNGTEKDFVKPYDTVNFVDGNGTTAVVETTENKTSTVKYNVNVGNGLEKNDANQITVKPADTSLVVDAAGVKVNTGTINNVTTGDKAGTVVANTDDDNKVATVGNVVNAINNAAWTATSAATTAGELGATATNQLVKAGDKVTFEADKNIKITQNAGKFTFATKDNVTFETVQVGGDQGPKLSKTDEGDLKVSGQNGTDPVKITNVKPGEISETSTDAINGSQIHGLVKNTIKLAGKNGETAAGETEGQALNKEGGIKFTVKSSDGSLLEVAAEGDTITLTPKTGKITTGADGVPTANTDGGKLVTADQLVTALTEMGWKATADKEGTGTVEGNAEELIKAGSKVTFKAGDNLAVKQAGKDFIYSLKTELTGLTSAEFKNAAGDKTVINGDGVTITPVTNGKQPVSLTTNGLNNGGNPITNVAGNLDGAKAGTDAPTTKHDAPNTTEATGPNYVNPNNAATVGDVLQAGWNLQNNGTEKDFVKPYDTVNFVDGNGTTAVVETTENKTSTVKYSVNLGDGLEKDATTNKIKAKAGDGVTVGADGIKVNTGKGLKIDATDGNKVAVNTDDKTIAVGDDGKVKAVTGSTEAVTDANKGTGEKAGQVRPVEADKGKLATVDTVAQAVNSAKWIAKATNTGADIEDADKTNDSATTGEGIAAGDEVTFTAGKNLRVNRNGKNFTFATDKNVSFDSVKVGADDTTANGKKPVNLTTEAAKDASNNDDANKPTTALNISSGTGTDAKPTQLVGVGSVLNKMTINTTPTGTVPAGSTPTTEDLVNLNEAVNKNAAATVGDLQNMGWKVSSDKTTGAEGAYLDVVKNANEVRFVGEGTAVVSGKTDGNVRTITVKVDDQVSTNNSVTPVVYTKADGTKVYPVKNAQGKIEYHTTPDGKGAGDQKIDDDEVITSVNGPKGTKAPTTLSNVEGNLDGAKTGTTAPTTNHTGVDTKNPTATNYVNPHNAATVGDVLNAGWNLQNNGAARDFVKPYDTVNFINGKGTVAVVETAGDATSSTVKFDVDAGEITADENKPGAVKGPNTTGKTPTELAKNLADAQKAVDDLAKDPSATEDAKQKAQDALKAAQDESALLNKVATAQNVADMINKSGFTLKADKTEGDNLTADDLAKGEMINPGDTITMKAGKNMSVKHEKDGSITYATKDDVSFNTVNVGGDNTYVDENGKPVTKKEDGTYVDENGQPIEEGKVTKLAPVAMKAEKAKPASNNGTDKTPTTALNVSSTDGKPTQITGVGSTLNVNPVNTNPNGTATTSDARPNLVDLVGTNKAPVNKNAAATVGDLQNMGWIVGAPENGYVDTVKNANKVDFKGENGISVTGKTNDKGVREITISVAEGKVTNDVKVTKADGTVIDGVKGPDGKLYKKGPDGKPDTSKEITLAEGDKVNNEGSKFVSGNAVATAIQESGWNVGLADSSKANAAFSNKDKALSAGKLEKVNPNDNVRFADGKGTKAAVATVERVDEFGKKVTDTYVKFDVDAGEITADETKPGAVKGPVTADEAKKLADDLKKAEQAVKDLPADATEDKKAEAQKALKDAQAAAAPLNKVATTQNVAEAINNSGWRTNSKTAKGGAKDTLINPGKAVNFEAGKNMEVAQTVDKDGNVAYTYKTKDDVQFNSVQFGDANGPKITNNGGNINVSGADGKAPAKITGVAAGDISPNSTDAVNGVQLYALAGDQKNVTPTNNKYDTIEYDSQNNPKYVTKDAPTGKTVVTEKIDGHDVAVLKTYNVHSQKEIVTNSVVEAIYNMNEQGIKFFHSNDGVDRPKQEQDNNFDSSASGKFATAIGSRSKADGTNAVAIGFNSVVTGNDSISIGTGNRVTGNNSGAFGDPSTVSGQGSYSVGNNNTVSTNDTFVLGNDVKHTVQNSAILGAKSTARGGNGSKTGTLRNLKQDGTQGASTTAGSTGTVSTATVGHMTYGGFQGAKADGVVSVGAAGKERRVQNVAAGEISSTSTDAINGSQLYAVAAGIGHKLGDLDNKINKVGKRADAGTASALAAATIPQAYTPGKSLVGIAAGNYQGQNSLAVGMSRISDNGKIIIRLSGTANTQGKTGVAAGVGYQW